MPRQLFLLFLLCTGYFAGYGQADDFWNRLNLTAKILTKKAMISFPGPLGVSLHWNNGVQFSLADIDRLPSDYTTGNIDLFFAMSTEKRMEWQEALQGTFMVTDSADKVSVSPAWSTGLQLCVHAGKGLGVWMGFDHASGTTSQTNYLWVQSLVNPSAPPGYMPLESRRRDKIWSIGTGLLYQYPGKRVQPGASMGYRVSFLNSDGFSFSLANDLRSETVETSARQILHGWEMQAFVKIFLIRGLYLAPGLAYGQSFRDEIFHAFRMGAGCGYQLAWAEK